MARSATTVVGTDRSPVVPTDESSQQVPATLPAGLPPAEMLDDVDTMGGAGVSDDSRDFLLPFLAIAQSNSPQVKRQQADRYIEGLEPGDIFNTATGKFWKADEGLLVLPAFFQKAEVEWYPRPPRGKGGYVATHPVDTPLANRVVIDPRDPRMRILAKTPDRPLETQLVETAYHFVVEVESLSPAILGMTSTNLSISRGWMTLMREFKIRNRQGQIVTAPSFGRLYRVTTVFRTNDAGDWFQFKIRDEGWTLPTYADAYATARAFFIQAQEHGIQLGRPPVDVWEDEESNRASRSPENVDADLPI